MFEKTPKLLPRNAAESALDARQRSAIEIAGIEPDQKNYKSPGVFEALLESPRKIAAVGFAALSLLAVKAPGVFKPELQIASYAGHDAAALVRGILPDDPSQAREPGEHNTPAISEGNH